MESIVITKANEGKRIDKFLLKQYPIIPKSLVYKLFRKKQIKVNKKAVKFDYILQAGDELLISSNIFGQTLQKLTDEKEKLENIINELNIVYEDENIMIVFKESGVLSQPNQKEMDTSLITIVNKYLKLSNPTEYRHFSVGSINRLDRNTEGLLLFGKNYQSLKLLNEAMKDGKIKKYYLTLVKGIIKQQKLLNHYIVKNVTTNIVSIFEEKVPGALECKSIIKPIAYKDNYTLLEVELLTGRSHQIRAQLAYIDHPVVGDPKYGDPETNEYFQKNFDLEWQYLIAYKLAFENLTAPLTYLNYKTFIAPENSFLMNLTRELFGDIKT